MDASKPLRKEKTEQKQTKDLARAIVIRIVYFLLGVLISRGAVLGELSPFGPAFVAAVPFRYTLSAIIGSMAGYIFSAPADAFRYMAVIVAIGSLKWLLSDFERITRSRLFAPLLTFVPMLSTGIVMLYVSTSRLSELGICIVEAMISSAAAYFIYRSIELMLSLRSLSGFSAQETACLTVSVCIVMLSIGSVNFFGISAGRLLAVITVLLCARYGGVAGGSISGIATGVVFSLQSVSMAFLSGAYAFSGLAGGIFSSVGKVAVALAFTLCNTVLSLASADEELILSLFIECLLGAGVFMLIPASFGNTIRAAFSPTERKSDSEAMRRTVTARLDHAAYALEGVTECVSAVAKKLQKISNEDEDMSMFESAVKNTCGSCGLKVYCWDKMTELTRDDFRKLSEILRQTGYVNEKDIGENFVKRCCKQRELATSINDSYNDYLSNLAAQRRIMQVRSVVADQFSGLSNMLWDLSEEFDSCDNFDMDSADRITDALKQKEIRVIDCSCSISKGKGMTVELELVSGKKKPVDIKLVHKVVSRSCGRRFDPPTESVAMDRMRLAMSEISQYDVEIGTSQHISGNGNLCGDCLDYFMNGMGSMVAVISDGMGSGGAAAVDSNMAVSILSKLLRAGLSYDCALSVVNSSLMIKSEEESMATLDVADINLFTGKVSFLKAGAPVTYVRKGGRVHRREFPSLPVGILGDAKFMKDTITLFEDDAILMVTDGVLAGDDKWVEDLLKNWNEAPAQDFASVVVNEAQKRRKDPHDDDITVVAIKMIENG
ncbi:MAG: SpoIIE family protein phosphatase [Ruminococcus sp.]|nr:SpoIIE family protein phosphatase [Ruminococcus sp.]